MKREQYNKKIALRSYNNVKMEQLKVTSMCKIGLSILTCDYI